MAYKKEPVRASRCNVCFSPQCWLTFWRRLWLIFPALPHIVSSLQLSTKVSAKDRNQSLFFLTT